MAIITDGVRTKFTDDTGLPLIGGQVFSYVEGTSTPKDTYQDRAFTIPNTNPIILDDVGSCEMFLKGGYRLRVLTADGVLVEEKDNAFQSDGQVLDVVANTNAIAALQTNVDVLNTRGGLKTDENNHVIGQGKAESATVYDLSLRSDKIRVSAPNDIEFGSLVFKTYDAPTVVNGVTIPTGTWLNPALVTPLLGTAATKNIGSSNGQLPLVEQVRSIAVSEAYGKVNSMTAGDKTAPDNAPNGINYLDAGNGDTTFPERYNNFVQFNGLASSRLQIYYPYVATSSSVYFRRRVITSTGGWQPLEKVYTSGNTTVVNGNLKPSSPVVKIYTDSLELNHDAEQMGITLNKRGVGDYLIQNTSGLRKDDGWYIELPQDVNGNPYFAVTYEQLENNDIEIKTYKRIFDMNTFMFVPDLDSPVDIKDGRYIAIRLNDAPTAGY